MKDLTIRFVPDADHPCCGECGKRLHAAQGPTLFADEEPVCRDCGSKHGPQVVALVDLAHVADRVGKVCRHALVPPMEALLALARAAEDFNHHAPRLVKKAG